MRRLFVFGLTALIAYALVAAVIYQREALKFSRQETDANYRLGDAEEIRREVAEQIQVSSHKVNDYEGDPAYQAAEAKVEAILATYPDARGLTALRDRESRIGGYAAAAYTIVLAMMFVRRALSRKT